MDVGASFVADREPAAASNPGQRAFDDPAVSAQAVAAVNAAARNPGDDRAATQRLAAARVIISFVGVQLGGAATRSTARLPDRWDEINDLLQNEAVVDIGGAEQHGQRE